MKKIILWSALTIAVSSPLHAEEPAVSQPVATPPPVSAPETNNAPPTTPAADATTANTTAAEPTQTINCDFKIPTKTQVEQPTVSTWTKNATIQAFTFSAATIDTQLANLKKCFTDQGWQGFNDALQKSGNLDAIKSQQLTVSSMVQGDPSFLDSKTNQWKLNLPLQVVYQNTKEKISQELNVTVLVGRKSSGDLGILQMIALPREEQPAAATTPAQSTPEAAAPAESQPAETKPEPATPAAPSPAP